MRSHHDRTSTCDTRLGYRSAGAIDITDTYSSVMVNTRQDGDKHQLVRFVFDPAVFEPTTSDLPRGKPAP